MLKEQPTPDFSELDAASMADIQMQLENVAELARDLAGRFELSPLLGRIIQNATTLLGCDSGSISLVDEANGTYTKKADIGVGCQEGQTFPLSEGFTGQLVKARGTMILEKYSKISNGHIAKDDPRWNCAAIGVPIMWDGQVVGSCVVFGADPQRTFTEEDAHLVELFADHAAIALANARLYTMASEREREAAIAEERTRAARDVQETLGRSLASLLLNLDDVEKGIQADMPVTQILGTARAIAHDALNETRRTALGLGPGSMDGRSLAEAITTELNWVESMSGAATSMVVVGTPRTLPPEIAHQAFKIVQEALNNVVTHARAATVRVGIIYRTHDMSVLIEDDGRGFDLKAAHGDHSSLPSGCLGLHGMSSRASHLGGELSIETTPGWGTKVRATLPDSGDLFGGEGKPRWKVLIASTQPIVSAGLVRLLHLNEPAINVIAEVENFSQLLDAYELLKPDVILVDLEMLHTHLTEDNGDDRKLDEEASIVVFTNNPSPDQIRSAKQAGVRGYINRKANADTIARILVAAGQGEALLDGDMLEHLTEMPRGTSLGADAPTIREREVLEMVAEGLPDKQIAAKLQISVKTVEKHVGSLLRKTGARNRTMLVSFSGDSSYIPH